MRGFFSFLFHFEVEKGLRVLRRLKKYIESSAELWKIELAGFRVKIFGSSGRTFWSKNFELKSYSFSESRLRFFRFEKLESRFLLVEILVGVIKSFDSKFSDRVTIALIARLIRRLCSRSPYFVRLIFWNCRLFFLKYFTLAWAFGDFSLFIYGGVSDSGLSGAPTPCLIS